MTITLFILLIPYALCNRRSKSRNLCQQSGFNNGPKINENPSVVEIDVLTIDNFLVADTRLYNPLFGPLVRRSVGRSQSCFSTFSAPAHPSATNAAVYTALF